MDLTGIISRIFSIVFILILLYFIFRSLYLMRQDKTVGFQDPAAEDVPDLGLLVTRIFTDSAIPEGSVVTLADGLTIGRKGHNDIMLAAPMISSQHVQFFVHDGRYIIEDLHSTNGTFLNGQRLKESASIMTGDIIGLGAAEFTVVSRGGSNV